jgi:hypothetical protein
MFEPLLNFLPPDTARTLAGVWGATPTSVAVGLTITTLLSLVLLVALLRSGAKRRALMARFAPILDEEKHLENLRQQRADQESDLENKRQSLEHDIEITRSTYREKRQLLEHLQDKLAVYDEKLALTELGIYEPHFEFDDSEAYKEAIRRVRDEQKRMVQKKQAVTCGGSWMVEGSKAKGQTMINRQIRLTLRAFNNECEAAIANVRWNNYNAMEKRIENAAKQIDKVNESLMVIIESDYLNLRKRELRLAHERREKQKAEREERAEAARLAREEQKLIRDAERAEAEEQRYQQMLDRARKEAEMATGSDLERLRTRIEALESDLSEAHSASERARAMAEMTRTGFVYVISNVGAFGEDVVKIGLTRRLDPDDRVRELGDASVPFPFDTHAMIYSEDAPALEAALHTEFDVRRVNAANMRKEFFRVSLDEVEEAVHRLAPEASFLRDREAQEYHETLARRRQLAEAVAIDEADTLPDAI